MRSDLLQELQRRAQQLALELGLLPLEHHAGFRQMEQRFRRSNRYRNRKQCQHRNHCRIDELPVLGVLRSRYRSHWRSFRHRNRSHIHIQPLRHSLLDGIVRGLSGGQAVRSHGIRSRHRIRRNLNQHRIHWMHRSRCRIRNQMLSRNGEQTGQTGYHEIRSHNRYQRLCRNQRQLRNRNCIRRRIRPGTDVRNHHDSADRIHCRNQRQRRNQSRLRNRNCIRRRNRRVTKVRRRSNRDQIHRQFRNLDQHRIRRNHYRNRD